MVMRKIAPASDIIEVVRCCARRSDLNGGDGNIGTWTRHFLLRASILLVFPRRFLLPTLPLDMPPPTTLPPLPLLPAPRPPPLDAPFPRLLDPKSKLSVDSFVFCLDFLPPPPNPYFLFLASRLTNLPRGPLPRFDGRSEIASSTATSNASSSACGLSRPSLRSENGQEEEGVSCMAILDQGLDGLLRFRALSLASCLSCLFLVP